MSAESAEMVEAEPLVSPADPKRVLEVMRRFEEFKRQALTPNDFVVLDLGKEKRPYIKKSGWMKYALACQLSLEKRDERLEERPDGSKVYHYTYRAVAPNGRYADAVGSASTMERAFSHPDHDVRALAQTRACNRAISNLVAGGEVSAEEMISDIKEATTAQPDSQPGHLRVAETQDETHAPEAGSLAVVTDEALADALQKLPWRPNRSGKGENLRWDDVPQQFRAKLGLKLNETNGKAYVKVGEYSYRRFGDENEWLVRYLAKAPDGKGTSLPEEAPQGNEQRPVKRTWKIPALKDLASPDLVEQGLRQLPLGRDLQSFGMLNILGDEISLVPEHPVTVNTALIDGFLVRRILEPMRQKHAGFSYELQPAENDREKLKAVLIYGKLEDQQIKELANAARWCFERALQEGGVKP